MSNYLFTEGRIDDIIHIPGKGIMIVRKIYGKV